LTDYIWFGYGVVARFCEHSNEPSASSGSKDEELLAFLSDINFSTWFPLHGINRLMYFKLGLLGLRPKNHGQNTRLFRPSCNVARPLTYPISLNRRNRANNCTNVFQRPSARYSIATGSIRHPNAQHLLFG
jgi:hypothetical protein